MEMSQNILRLYKRQSMEHFYPFIKNILEISGFLDFLQKEGCEEDWQDLYALLQTIQKWSENNADFTIANTIQRLEAHTKYGIMLGRKTNTEENGKNAVQVLTAHQSKGLEYDSVFVP